MFIEGKDLPKQIVEILDAEQKLMEEVNRMNERFETARNLKNEAEYVAIENEGALLETRFKMFMARKIIVMSIIVSRNRNFSFN